MPCGLLWGVMHPWHLRLCLTGLMRAFIVISSFRCCTPQAMSARGRFAVTSSDDGCTRVWDLASFAESLAVPGHKARVRLVRPCLLAPQTLHLQPV